MEVSHASSMTAVFREALERFVEKIKGDDQVIAAILLGSMSYDQVWEKSDIDLKLIVHDQKLGTGYTCFVENDIPINASIQTRNEFKRWMESSMQSAFSHSMLVRSTLLFTKDESITEYMEQIRHVGKRDRELHLVLLGCHALGMLAKAEKWLYVKDDMIYSAAWVIKMADVLAQIEVVFQGEVPMREVVQQALRFNPDFFNVVYTEMVGAEVNRSKVEATLRLVDGYLKQRAEAMFQPIISYLKEEADIRTVTNLFMKFRMLIPVEAGPMASACDLLAEQGLITKWESETKATPKSRVPLLEPAYAYDNDEMEMWMNG
ncbi:hypothetical protein D3P07_04900 [Paenibacillus sp. 1011MAR3C5]|uniref:hypothetical protein n=1 Tax=Paenibacillus sp. 1011MAR3C5 TaxID=1675787 RepID=UPI000E6D3B5E|nr:hypothetical protein [Paenibacillus sp. 1011MAR3C5]RJE89587.1 hypothetical protein D3P07_04900 [Paenibacillus sp. 1011MAR3C5]